MKNLEIRRINWLTKKISFLITSNNILKLFYLYLEVVKKNNVSMIASHSF